MLCKSRYGSESRSSVRMTSQKLCEHVERIASCTNREAYERRGFTVIVSDLLFFLHYICNKTVSVCHSSFIHKTEHYQNAPIMATIIQLNMQKTN